jgi:hypothetical protein
MAPVLVYGPESWALTKGKEQKLRTFARKVLSNAYGPTGKTEGRIIMSCAPEIMKTVKLVRLRWLEHLARANETSPYRKLISSKHESTRRT